MDPQPRTGTPSNVWCKPQVMFYPRAEPPIPPCPPYPMAIPLDLRAEAHLDPSLHYRNPLSAHWQQPRTLLLTGATGFLGLYLLGELLTQTQAQIYCLVRANDAAAARQRLQGLWQEYQLDPSLGDRVQPLVGDLSQPHLGLSATAFTELGSRLDGIYHSGAGVAVTQPYDRLKAINVGGTQTLLHLAHIGQTTPFHYLSSLGLFFGQGTPAQGRFQESDFPEPASVKGGYKQTKVVSELLIQAAQERGLPACIYRPGRILGHSATGIIDLIQNPKDFLFILLIACVQLGCYPQVEEAIEAAPVDYFSRAIVHLAHQPASFCQVFHLLNSRPSTWLDLVATTQGLGYGLEGVTVEAWVEQWRQRGAAVLTPPLQGLLSQVIEARGTALFPPKPGIDDGQTAQALGTIAGAYPPPSLDKTLLQVYFRYFHRQGAVSQPPLA